MALDDLERKVLLGGGSTAKIYLVQRKGMSNEVYVMKSTSKAHMVENGMILQLQQEREILCMNDSPFLISMSYAF
jgi:hypothetical protein